MSFQSHDEFVTAETFLRARARLQPHLHSIPIERRCMPIQEKNEADSDLQKTAMLLEFAKFGFTGTLAAGLSGMALILCLAVLDAFTEFEISTWGLVAIALIVLAGGVAFGY